MANAAWQAKNYAEAAHLFQAVGEQLAAISNAQAPAVLGNAALAHMKAGDYNAASRIYERLLLDYKELPREQLLRHHANLAVCLGLAGQRREQLIAIENMFKALPDLSAADRQAMLFQRGDAYRHLELYKAAIADYEEALNLAPGDDLLTARLLTALALCQGNLGNYTDARANLEKALKLARKADSPQTLTEALSNLGALAWEQGDYDKAENLLQKALETALENDLPRNAAADSNQLGMVYISKGKYDAALKMLEQALKYAREAESVRSQGIALENRALLNRIRGQYKEAFADYGEAEKLFQKAGFQEGMASALLGAGRMAELNDKNYILALDNYARAIELFTRLDLPRWQAAALLLMGDLHKRIATPGRSVRDLDFGGEPECPDMSRDEAIQKAGMYYTDALALAQKLSNPEILWRAHQGLGFVNRQNGELEKALDNYKTAIDIAASLFTSPDDVKLMGEYIAEREDLYKEAIEICDLLHKKSGDPQYLTDMTSYAESLRNEMHKAATATVRMEYEDAAKQKLYNKLQELGRARTKAGKAVESLPAAATAKSDGADAAQEAIAKAANAQKSELARLEAAYVSHLAQWKTAYKEDASVFDASDSRIKIGQLQEKLAPGQALLYYISLPDTTLITVITKHETTHTRVNLGAAQLKKLIIEDFVVGYVHKGFKMGGAAKPGGNELYFKKAVTILKELYALLIKPVEARLKGIARLYIVADGYFSQIPFNILVCGEKNGVPEFLVEKYELSYLRPSFIDNFMLPKSRGKVKKMLAIANPRNENFPMSMLEGSIDEIGAANRMLKGETRDDRDIAMEHYAGQSPFEPKDVSERVKREFPDTPDINKIRPTEAWLRDKLANNNYELLYFATHGQAHSDTFSKLENFRKKNLQNSRNKKTRRAVNSFMAMRDKNVPENTPLNGFLLLSSEPDDHVLDADLQPSPNTIPRERDGLLTIREIMNLDKKNFANTKYVFLSACNTAVSLVPFALSENSDENAYFDQDLVEKDLRKMGLAPGVDQATFVESFMRKGVENIYASFWQLDDEAAKSIMQAFWKELMAQEDNPDLTKAYALAQRAHLATYKQKMASSGSLPEDLHPYYWGAGAIFGK